MDLIQITPAHQLDEEDALGRLFLWVNLRYLTLGQRS